jgi:hypothetical protein
VEVFKRKEFTMEIKTLQEVEAEISKAYIERHPDASDRTFGEADEFVLQSILDGKEHFEYDALNNAAQLAAVDLDGVPTDIVITYEFNHFATLDKPIRLTLNAMCGGHLTPLCHKHFNHTDKDGLKKAIDTLYVRAYAVAEGVKAEA